MVSTGKIWDLYGLRVCRVGGLVLELLIVYLKLASNLLVDKMWSAPLTFY